jgi:hypothetical protein
MVTVVAAEARRRLRTFRTDHLGAAENSPEATMALRQTGPKKTASARTVQKADAPMNKPQEQTNSFRIQNGFLKSLHRA